jgi:hypothetical protein
MSTSSATAWMSSPPPAAATASTTCLSSPTPRRQYRYGRHRDVPRAWNSAGPHHQRSAPRASRRSPCGPRRGPQLRPCLSPLNPAASRAVSSPPSAHATARRGSSAGQHVPRRLAASPDYPHIAALGARQVRRNLASGGRPVRSQHQRAPRPTATSRPVTPHRADGRHRAMSIAGITLSDEKDRENNSLSHLICAQFLVRRAAVTTAPNRHYVSLLAQRHIRDRERG